MKTFLLGAAAAAAAIAAPSLASAETTASTEYEGGGEFDATTLGGAVQFDAMTGWSTVGNISDMFMRWD